MTHKQTAFMLSFLILGIALCLLAPDAMALKDDAMKDSAQHLEALVRGNLARIVVGCGILWGVVHGVVQSKPILVGGSVGTGVLYAASNYWIDNAFTLLI